jgi:hypothetical protein
VHQVGFSLNVKYKNQVGFSLNEYIEMHGQQNIKLYRVTMSVKEIDNFNVVLKRSY